MCLVQLLCGFTACWRNFGKGPVDPEAGGTGAEAVATPTTPPAGHSADSSHEADGHRPAVIGRCRENIPRLADRGPSESAFRAPSGAVGNGPHRGQAPRPPGRRTAPPPPRIGARHPSGTDCWLGATPQRREDGAVRPIPPGANRGMPRWGVAPSHAQGARIGTGAPLAVAQPLARQRHRRPGPCPAERPFPVRRPQERTGHAGTAAFTRIRQS